MDRTALACLFLFAKLAVIKTLTGIVCQSLILVRHCFLLQMMATI